MDGEYNNHYDCTDSGFREHTVKPCHLLCWLNPCHDDATCENTVNSSICHSWPGYRDALCEMDTNEDGSSPCHFGEMGGKAELSSDLYRDIAGLPSFCQYGFTNRSLV